MNVLLKEARQLANYLESINYKDFVFTPPVPYNHIGALFTDIILQSVLNYTTVVRPRVARVFRLFPDAYSISNFESSINEHGIKHVINWQNEIKANRILALIKHSKVEGIEFENDLRDYLTINENCTKLLLINGIGSKTLDYTLKLLCVDTVAVDRHVFSFIQKAGIIRNDYYEVKAIVEYAADLLESSRIKLDTFIWRTMSKNHNVQQSFSF